MAEQKLGDMKHILREEVRKYAGRGWGLGVRLLPLLDDENETYAVNAVDYPERKDYAVVVVLARLLNGKIVIEEDATNKKLVDALLQRGISRNDIILAYENEPVPETAPKP